MAKKKQEQPKATVAELSSELSDLLNAHEKEAAAAPCSIATPAKKAASRSNYKGELILPNPKGGVFAKIPVKTYVAIDEDKIERHMYHSADCLNRVEQGSMTCKGCGDAVEKENTIKGIEVDGKVVLISDEELKAQQPFNEKKIEILEYIDEAEINPIYYEDAEFIVADGKIPALTAFAALREGLKRTGRVAKGKRVKGGREQYFILRPYGQHGMTLHYLYAEYEIRSCDKWSPIAVDEAIAQKMAQLIEATSVPFAAAPQDNYMSNVRRLISQKAAGTKVTVPEQEPEPEAADDLIAALTEALEAAKAKKAAAAK